MKTDAQKVAEVQEAKRLRVALGAAAYARDRTKLLRQTVRALLQEKAGE